MQFKAAIFDTKLEFDDTKLPSSSYVEFVLDLLEDPACQERHVPSTVQLGGSSNHEGPSESVLFPKVLGEVTNHSLHVFWQSFHIKLVFRKCDFPTDRLLIINSRTIQCGSH